MGLSTLLIVGAQRAEDVDAEAMRYVDALYWKSIEGYDFSAYAIGLRAIASRSAHATALVLNDSVFGPLADVRPFVAASPWDMLGFTASSLHENHVQSYAFILRDVTAARLVGLEDDVFPQAFAYSYDDDVIKCQELQLARVAARTMSVGACWYGASEQVADPMLCRPRELVAAGHPFLKRSVFGGKHHQAFQSEAQQALGELLRSSGHPV